jgi:hypothetical protein
MPRESGSSKQIEDLQVRIAIVERRLVNLTQIVNQLLWVLVGSVVVGNPISSVAIQREVVPYISEFFGFNAPIGGAEQPERDDFCEPPNRERHETSRPDDPTDC